MTKRRYMFAATGALVALLVGCAGGVGAAGQVSPASSADAADAAVPPRDCAGSETTAARSLADLLSCLANSPDPDLRRIAATHPQTPLDLQRALSRDDWAPVREVLARSVTHTDVLRALADDVDPYVRRRVAENPAATREVLDLLATPGEKLPVLEAVASHPHLSEENQRWLASFAPVSVQRALARAAQSETTLRLLSHSQDRQVLTELTHNAAAPRDVVLAVVTGLVHDAR